MGLIVTSMDTIMVTTNNSTIRDDGTDHHQSAPFRQFRYSALINLGKQAMLTQPIAVAKKDYHKLRHELFRQQP